MCIRAVRLIEIEIKSRFDIARFRNRFIARFFSAPRPNLLQYAIWTNQNAAEQNRPGIQTDSMLKKQGRWVQNRIRTWWPKKCMLQRSYFLQSRERLSEDSATLSATERSAHTQRNIEPLRSHALVASCFVWFDYSHIHIIYNIYICILPFVCSRDMLQLFGKGLIGFLWKCFKFTQNAFITVKVKVSLFVT